MSPVISATAQEWVIRTRHPEFEDWDALGLWMSADVRHADEFNRLSLLDQDIAEAVAALPPHGEPIPLLPRTRSRWHGWALAASFALLAVPAGLFVRHRTVVTQPASEMAISTRPGETRTLAFPDGTSIAVAGGSSLTIDKAARRVDMGRGLATFSVEHDAAHPFAVTLGDITVTDVGTVFEIRRRGDESVVSVGRGEVRVDSRDNQPVRLVAGQQVRLSSQRTFETGASADGSVGQWQRGVLEYDGATIADVAADIQDLTGAQVTASPAIADRRFAGTIAMAGDPGQALQHISPLLGVTVRRHGEAWILEPSSNAITR
ncbi:FecR family protein [Sphingomonas oryzagri]|nr:FecR domain-containing protein [Sphingomonas oryzagri]